MRKKCETCGIEITNKLPMAQTVEQWRHLYSLAHKAMLKDKRTISYLKNKVNNLKQQKRSIKIEKLEKKLSLAIEWFRDEITNGVGNVEYEDLQEIYNKLTNKRGVLKYAIQ
jgi:phage shock protein A